MKTLMRLFAPPTPAKTLIGFFASPATAEEAVAKLHSAGVPDDQFILLTPQTLTDLRVGMLPKSHVHEGSRTTTGHVAGAIAGFAGGAVSGITAALLIPGIGPALAVGTFALACVIGAAVGAAAGGALQQTFAPRLSYEDLFVYKDALRHGHEVLIVQPSDEVRAETARRVLAELGAEDVDHAREEWWHRLQDSESAPAGTPHDQFTAAEVAYFRGFEAALDPGVWGHSYAEAAALMQKREPVGYQEEPFRRGYERGQAYQRTKPDKGHKESVNAPLPH